MHSVWPKWRLSAVMPFPFTLCYLSYDIRLLFGRLEALSDCLSQFRSRRRSANIRCANRRLGQSPSDRILDSGRRLRCTEMSQHERARPYLADGICDAFACDIGCRTVHRFKHRWVLPFGVKIGGGSHANRTCHGRPKIRENITEEIRSNNYIKPVRMPHKMRGQKVDVILVRSYIRILST